MRDWCVVADHCAVRLIINVLHNKCLVSLMSCIISAWCLRLQIIVLWHCDIPPPPSRRWPADLGVPVLVKTRNI